MTVIGTCGHELSEEWMDSEEGLVYYKEHYSDYEMDCIVNCVAFGEVCQDCKKKYEEWGILLHNEEEQKLWLEGKLEQFQQTIV